MISLSRIIKAILVNNAVRLAKNTHHFTASCLSTLGTNLSGGYSGSRSTLRLVVKEVGAMS